MSQENVKTNDGINRAKMYQLVLFPMNNGATNVYFVLILSYVAIFGSTVLFFAAAAYLVTLMRLFDAITDPIIGALMDRTNTRFGKFRPFMVIGNLIMAVSVILLYVGTPLIPEDMQGLRNIAFIVLYAIWVIGYTFQTSVTRSGQTVLTNDPKQRPMFTIFNTVASLLGMGVMQFLIPIVADNIAPLESAKCYAIITPIGVALSAFLTILAIIGIAQKDNEKYFGISTKEKEKTKISEYIEIVKANKPLQRLMIAGGGCKLALSIAINTSVVAMLYNGMMGDYGGLYLPMMIVGYVFSLPFFVLSLRTSQKEGQKASLVKYVSVALLCYVGVLVLLLLWNPENSAFCLSIMGENGLAINLYTVLFILFYGLGYGAYYATADMPIPMVADCSDYETYRSGKYIPGIMGTLFSLVDKLVSSLSSTVVQILITCLIGWSYMPGNSVEYADGMKTVVIITFCVIPMLAWILTLWAMKGYELTGARMKEIQAINHARKEAIENGLTIEEAMSQIQAVEDIVS